MAHKPRPVLSGDREDALRAAGARVVAGVDEVGRGPLAGPVMAAAVVLDPAASPGGLCDSKRLRPAERERLCAALEASAIIGLGEASVAEIDALDILQATFLAMRRAVAALPVAPCHLLIDGNRLPPGLPCPADAIVKGDAVCPSIAAASIVAKTRRDCVMKEAATRFPGYGWDTNVGYGTRCHMDALRDLGPTPWHRRSFAPLRDILWQAKISSD